MDETRASWGQHRAISFALVFTLAGGMSGCPTSDDDAAVDDDADDDVADDDTGDDDTSTPWSTINVGLEVSCGLHEGGRAECWGANAFGQLEPPEGVAFQKIAAGQFHVCGLTTEGAVACWGIEDGSTLDEGQVTAAPSGTFTDLSTFGHQSCAITLAGSIECWGEYNFSDSAAELKQIDLGRYHYCGLQTDNTVRDIGIPIP